MNPQKHSVVNTHRISAKTCEPFLDAPLVIIYIYIYTIYTLNTEIFTFGVPLISGWWYINAYGLGCLYIMEDDRRVFWTSVLCWPSHHHMGSNQEVLVVLNRIYIQFVQLVKALFENICLCVCVWMCVLVNININGRIVGGCWNCHRENLKDSCVAFTQTYTQNTHRH